MFLDIFGLFDPITGYVAYSTPFAIPIIASSQISLLPEDSWSIRRVLPDASAVSTSNASYLSTIEMKDIYGQYMKLLLIKA